MLSTFVFSTRLVISFYSIFLLVEAGSAVTGKCADDSDCITNSCDKEKRECLRTHLSILRICMFSYL